MTGSRRRVLPSGLTVVTHDMDASRERRARRLGRRRLALRSATRSTASRICSSTWPSRAPRRARRADIAEEIEAVGGEVNAATSVETTSYYARVLKDDVPLAVDILSDILQNSVFDPEELAREQHVIVQEIGAALDTPEDRVFDLFAEAAFPDQPIGRTILGTAETVRGRRARRCSAAYLDRHYRGPAMVLAGGRRGRSRRGSSSSPSERFADARAARPARARRRPATAAATMREARDLMETQIMLGFEGLPYRVARISTPRRSSPRSSAAACRRACSRKCARSAASAIRSTPSTGASPTPASSASMPRPAPEDVSELMPVILGELERAAHDHRRSRSAARPGAAARRPADDARKPGGARRPAGPPDAAVRPASSRSRNWSRASRRSTVDAGPRARRATSSPAAGRRSPPSARSTA